MCHMDVTYVSMDVTYMLPMCHMDVTYMSYGCYLCVIWMLPMCLWMLPICLWILPICHMDVTYVSYGCYLCVIWMLPMCQAQNLFFLLFLHSCLFTPTDDFKTETRHNLPMSILLCSLKITVCTTLQFLMLLIGERDTLRSVQSRIAIYMLCVS